MRQHEFNETVVRMIVKKHAAWSKRLGQRLGQSVSSVTIKRVITTPVYEVCIGLCVCANACGTLVRIERDLVQSVFATK